MHLPKFAGLIGLLALAGLPLLPGTAAASTPYTPPASIDPTGATDVSAALQSWIASVPDGSTIVFPAGATYRIEETVYISHRSNLTIDGNGSHTVTTTTGDRTRRHFALISDSNLTIRNLTVKGANPNAGTGDAAYVSSLEAQHGFDIEGSDHLLLDHDSVTDVYGDFVYVGMNTSTGVWSSYVTIENSDLERNGRQGISVTAAQHVFITGNTITQVRRHSIDIEPNGLTWGADDVQIVGNTFGPARLGFVNAGPSGPVNDVTIKNNTLQGLAMGVSDTDQTGARRHGLVMSGNVSNVAPGSTDGAVVYLSNIDHVLITGNYQAVQPGRGMDGVKSWAACDVQVYGNQFVGADSELDVRTPCPTAPTSSAPSTPPASAAPPAAVAPAPTSGYEPPSPTGTTPTDAGPTTTAPSTAGDPAPTTVGTSIGSVAVAGAQQSPPQAGKTTKAPAASGGKSPHPTKSAHATKQAHAGAPATSAASSPDAATYISASDTAATQTRHPLLSTQVLAATVGGLTLLLLAGMRVVGPRPIRKVRTAQRPLTPAPTQRLGMDVLPQRFAR